MGVFSIGPCAQCGNKAEIKTYPGFNPQAVCENCQRDNERLEEKIIEKAGEKKQAQNRVVTEEMPVYVGDERELYIRTISNKATDEWLKRFIKEVVIKQVLRNDWKTIIRNERWFSLLDLRRFALEVDPDVDKPNPPDSVHIFEPKVRIKRGRPRKTQRRTEEPINAA